MSTKNSSTLVVIDTSNSQHARLYSVPRTAGDKMLLPKVQAACEHFTPMSDGGQEALIAEGGNYELIFDGAKALFPEQVAEEKLPIK